MVSSGVFVGPTLSHLFDLHLPKDNLLVEGEEDFKVEGPGIVVEGDEFVQAEAASQGNAEVSCKEGELVIGYVLEGIPVEFLLGYYWFSFYFKSGLGRGWLGFLLVNAG